MIKELNNIIVEEYNALKMLLSTLDEQFEYLAKREVFPLVNITEKIKQCSKQVARCEVERRKITKGQAMSRIVADMEDEELKHNYREIKKLLEAVQLQKDTNELLIKQNLGFTAQMLSLLNPDRGPKTYNSYGKRR